MWKYFHVCNILLALLFGCICPLKAQNLWKAKVKLNNSLIIKGYLSAPWDQENLYLKQSDSTVLLIEFSDIRSVKLINSAKGKFKFKHRDLNDSFTNNLGFYHQIFVGSSFGEEQLNGSLGLINGYRFNKLLAVDIGVNYDRFEKASTLPVYLQSRLYLKNDKLSVYYFTGIGYSLAGLNSSESAPYEKVNVKGGLMGQAGIGYQINFYKSALSFTLGYKLQRMITHYEYFSYWEDDEKTMDIEEKRLIRRVAFTIGFTI